MYIYKSYIKKLWLNQNLCTSKLKVINTYELKKKVMVSFPYLEYLQV